MHPIPPDQLLAALRWRYATKQFDPSRLIPSATWHALEEALILAPSSFGLQPWRFIHISNPDLRAQLRSHSWDQTQATDASHYLVIAAKTDVTPDDIESWIGHLAAARGTDPATLAPLHSMITGFISSMDAAARRAWTTRQCYIALGQLMASAALLGIDTCPLEGIDPAAYDRLLELEGTGYSTVVACAAGYRSPHDKYAALPKVRFPRGSLITKR